MKYIIYHISYLLNVLNIHIYIYSKYSKQIFNIYIYQIDIKYIYIYIEYILNKIYKLSKYYT